MATLVLLRHGESEWNAKGLFTGWVDVDLSAKGEEEARRGGETAARGRRPPRRRAHLLLTRAIQTANLALDAADLLWLPVKRSWRLNERHYGALQGKDKAQTRAEFGDEQFMLWRRSYDVPPPPIADDDEFSQAGDRRYALLPPRADAAHRVPEGRRRRACCRTGTTRSCPTSRPGATVLVAAHGNSLRALVKHLDGISDEDIAGLNIPTGIPLPTSWTPTPPAAKGGRYLDPEAAEAAIEAVANQGNGPGLGQTPAGPNEHDRSGRPAGSAGPSPCDHERPKAPTLTRPRL